MRNAQIGKRTSTSRVKQRSRLVRMRNYYRIFRAHAGPMKALYFAFRLTL